MSLYYVDTSAALKLLAEESHSAAFAAFYDANAGSSWVSSALLRIELVRAVKRGLPAVLPEAEELLLAFDYLSIDEQIVDAAASESEPTLRSLDAIHLATARALGSDLAGMVTYDDRLARAAHDARIRVIAPRD